ncbi:MAG TPA: hypothetical protein V6C78_17905 [Crinalium sp.]|jgi:hypothetical protein
MKLVEQSSTRLKLRANYLPGILFGMLLSAPFLIAGFTSITSLAKAAALPCDRPEPVHLACQSQAQFAQTDQAPPDSSQLLTAAEAVDYVSDVGTYHAVLQTQENQQWLAYPLGGLFMLLGSSLLVTMLVTPLRTTYVFDRAKNQLKLKQQYLFKSNITQRTLQDVKQAQLHVETNDEGCESYSVSLILQSGEEMVLPLTGITDQGKYKKIVDSIQAVLS